MTPEFLAAVIDTLLPGDDALPSGPQADVALTADAHAPVLEAVSAQAGGMDAFSSAPEPARVTILRAVEHAHPEAFRALLVAVLSDYYESAPVLTAMGWRSDPPQPLGHELPSSDTGIDKVRARSRLWRS
jgi:hypothetical protein